MKKRTIISIVILVILTALGYLYYHVSYSSKYHLYYGYYDDIRGLQTSSNIYVQGVKVGFVKKLTLNREDILATYAVDKHIELHEGTVAVLISDDLLGGKAINLSLGAEPGVIKPQSFLTTEVDTNMVDHFDVKISPFVHNTMYLLRTADSAFHSFNYLTRRGWTRRTKEGIAKVNEQISDVASLSSKANQKVQAEQPFFNSLDNTMQRVQGKTADIGKKIESADKGMKEFTQTSVAKDLEDLNLSFSKLSETFKKLEDLKLISDTTSYQNLANSLDTFNRSLQDYKENPPSPFNFRKKK